MLIVDDNPSNVALLVAVLRRAGYLNLFTETDSRLVLSRLPEIDPDLVILDLHMPHLDGFAVLDQIRHHLPKDAVPVLVLTADTTPAASDRALNGGARDFVTKPFANGEVLVRVRNLLRTRFMYTTLRSSILREQESALRARRLSSALTAEQEAIERLRLLDGLKDTLLQTVSHDLRSPIWSVLMMGDLLAGDADGSHPLNTETRLTAIDRIRQSTRQMEALLSDILDSDPMQRLDSRGQECNVGEVVSRILAEADLGRDHPLEVDIAGLTANIDPVHLERIVVNLLNNARQHLPSGVPIWVRVQPQYHGVVITVEDAGAGVPAEIGQSIFEPFRRGTTTDTGGLGLGLSLVSRFAQLHGGRAWQQERQGGGASFRVFLPTDSVPSVDPPLELGSSMTA